MLACLLYATVFVPFLSFFQSLSAQSRFIERLAKAAAADVLRALLKSVTGAQTLGVKMKRKKIPIELGPLLTLVQSLY